ncbi:TatD DNase family protein [Halopseudomonas xinjiangensis]|uniref:TatD DNase family protein n=1 Tax=Halopseudomonas xinjiangensis TaxID=487184 RepID=A0A1H1LHY5_9GAMM|nr:TatD family hydrolase [Halopseudomonas xinjiangensis]SDR73489.1 TatD DNase family protein [Halopseudomonas xinjiangensis]
MRLIDTHTHIDYPDFDADRQEVLARSHSGGVSRVLIMGVTRENWSRSWHLARNDERLHAAFGMHPIYLDEHLPEHLVELEEWLDRTASHPKCCAVGEIGLDFFLKDLDRERQQRLLEAQLQLAKEHDLPVLLHVRRAHAAMIATLKRWRLPRAGIVHAFAGSTEEAREYIKLGFKLGLGGAATWPQASRLRRVVASLPVSSLVLETDSPDMAPSFQAYQRNSPEYLPEICRTLADLRGESAEELAQACLHNTCELFGWQADAVP